MAVLGNLGLAAALAAYRLLTAVRGFCWAGGGGGQLHPELSQCLAPDAGRRRWDSSAAAVGGGSNLGRGQRRCSTPPPPLPRRAGCRRAAPTAGPRSPRPLPPGRSFWAACGTARWSASTTGSARQGRVPREIEGGGGGGARCSARGAPEKKGPLPRPSRNTSLPLAHALSFFLICSRRLLSSLAGRCGDLPGDDHFPGGLHRDLCGHVCDADAGQGLPLAGAGARHWGGSRREAPRNLASSAVARRTPLPLPKKYTHRTNNREIKPSHTHTGPRRLSGDRAGRLAPGPRAHRGLHGTAAGGRGPAGEAGGGGGQPS